MSKKNLGNFHRKEDSNTTTVTAEESAARKVQCHRLIKDQKKKVKAPILLGIKCICITKINRKPLKILSKKLTESEMCNIRRAISSWQSWYHADSTRTQ
eukprot:11599290-Ditylum_brightwellii.AAC.1